MGRGGGRLLAEFYDMLCSALHRICVLMMSPKKNNK